MKLTLRENYWDSPALKSEFKRFMIELFGLDLGEWDRRGFWDPLYQPFSYFDGDTLVSNVCIYTMSMTLDGNPGAVAQVSAVGTTPEYRRKGLSSELLRVALDWARERHDYFFLFADEGAFQLYEKFGFRPQDEYKARIAVTGRVPRPGLLKLDMSRAEHIAQAYRLATVREPVSDALGCVNDKLLMFWLLDHLADCVYYIPELDLLALLGREGGLLTVFDVVGTTMPTFSELYPFISHPDDHTVEFFFMVDKLKLGRFDLVKIAGHGTHVLEQFPVTGAQFMFPFTAHA